MDKQATQLDPKLKEAYDRVMGTVVTPQAQPTPQPVAANPPPPPPTAQQAASPVMPQPQNTTGKAGFVNTAAKKKKGVSPIIIALGIIVFLVAYALVWIKIFNVKLF